MTDLNMVQKNPSPPTGASHFLLPSVSISKMLTLHFALYCKTGGVQIFQRKPGWQNLPPALEIPHFWGDAEMHQRSYTRISEKEKEQPLWYWNCGELLTGNLPGKCKKNCSSYKTIMGSSMPPNGFKEDWIYWYCVLSGLQRLGLKSWHSKKISGDTSVWDLFHKTSTNTA